MWINIFQYYTVYEPTQRIIQFILSKALRLKNFLGNSGQRPLRFTFRPSHLVSGQVRGLSSVAIQGISLPKAFCSAAVLGSLDPHLILSLERHFSGFLSSQKSAILVDFVLKFT